MAWMLRTVSAVLLAAILACSGAPRRIQLRAETEPEISFSPGDGGKVVQISDGELRDSVKALAADTPTPADPLGWAIRRFDVPERSGTYFYETRTQRLFPEAEGGPLVGAVSTDEFRRSYFEWCRDSEGEPGDCLRLLADGARPFTYYARYSVAMAMGW